MRVCTREKARAREKERETYGLFLWCIQETWRRSATAHHAWRRTAHAWWTAHARWTAHTGRGRATAALSTHKPNLSKYASVCVRERERERKRERECVCMSRKDTCV